MLHDFFGHINKRIAAWDEGLNNNWVIYLFKVSVNQVDPVLGNLKTTNEIFLAELGRGGRGTELKTYLLSLFGKYEE
jgi:hypothetical protein